MAEAGVSLEGFSTHVGERFLASAEAGGDPLASLVLAEAERLADEGELPFSLVFVAPADVRLGQGTYWLSRAGGEPEPIFLVPIAPDRYEAIFS